MEHLVSPPSPPRARGGFSHSPSVAELAVMSAVKVPAWFTVAAALRVACLKGQSHLLVVDRRAVVGSVSVAQLAAARPEETIGRRMVPCPVCVPPETPPDAALFLMRMHHLDCLPVARGPLLVGVITRAALSGQIETSAGC